FDPICDDIGCNTALDTTDMQGGMRRIKTIVQPRTTSQFFYLVSDPLDQSGCFMYCADFLSDPTAVASRAIDHGFEYTDSFLPDDRYHAGWFTDDGECRLLGVGLLH